MKKIGIVQHTFESKVDASTLAGDQLIFRTGRYELLQKIIGLGHYGCVVKSDDYLGQGKFRQHWYPLAANPLCYEHRGEIILDLAFDKSKFRAEDMAVLNPTSVVKICENKQQMLKIFADLQPKSCSIRTARDLPKIKQLDNGSGRVALKGLVSNGGQEVVIELIHDIIASKVTLPPFPLVAQEFIETKGGIPGLSRDRHDLRLVVLGGSIIGASLRTPAGNSLLSNTRQGGVLQVLELDQVPEVLQKILKVVDARLPQVPRLYSADFMYNTAQQRWYLIELNARPGLLAQFFDKQVESIQNKIAQYLVQKSIDFR